KIAARAVGVSGAHRRRCDLGVWRWPARFDRKRRLELESPERQVVPMAAEVAHGAVAEIPPAIPFRTGYVDRMKRPGRRGAEPEVPVEAGGHWLRLLGPFTERDDVLIFRRRLGALPAPGPR